MSLDGVVFQTGYEYEENFTHNEQQIDFTRNIESDIYSINMMITYTF